MGSPAWLTKDEKFIDPQLPNPGPATALDTAATVRYVTKKMISNYHYLPSDSSSFFFFFSEGYPLYNYPVRKFCPVLHLNLPGTIFKATFVISPRDSPWFQIPVCKYLYSELELRLSFLSVS